MAENNGPANGGESSLTMPGRFAYFGSAMTVLVLTLQLTKFLLKSSKNETSIKLDFYKVLLTLFIFFFTDLSLALAAAIFSQQKRDRKQ